MPNYDYKCLTCGYTFEYFQSMTDESLSDCPKCKGTLKRLIGPGAGTIFKGTGFYHTDYKSVSDKKKHNKKASKPADKNKKQNKKEK